MGRAICGERKSSIIDSKTVPPAIPTVAEMIEVPKAAMIRYMALLTSITMSSNIKALESFDRYNGQGFFVSCLKID